MGTRFAALLAALGLLGANIASWWPHLSDDALISLRYSERLLGGHGLTWTDGERVEGYSNLLWVLLCAALGGLGIDLIVAAQLLGVLAAVGCVAVVGHTLWRGPATGVLLGAGATALSAPLAGWSIGGLETPLSALLIISAVAALVPAVDTQTTTIKAVYPASGLLALACLTRPDAPILVAALVGGWWLAVGQNRAAARSAFVLALIPALATIGQILFRLHYYGEWVPNTAHAKVHAVDAVRIESGLRYLLTWADASQWLLLGAGLGLLGSGTGTRQVRRLLVPVVGVWVCWVVSVGGDHFSGWRFWVVLGPVLGLLLGSGTGALQRRWPALTPVLLLLSLPAGAAFWQAQQEAPRMAQIRYGGWVLEQEAVGKTLAAAFAPQRPLLATAAAGGVPYWSGLPALDILGLTDAHIAKTTASSGMIGHEVSDIPYVLTKKPDIVMICAARGGRSPCIPQEHALLDNSDFQIHYRMIRIQLDDMITEPWVRIDSPALGIVWEKDTIELPGWLLSGASDQAAVPEDSGVLSLTLREPVRLELPLPPGTWLVMEPEIAVLSDGVLTVTPTTRTAIEPIVLRRVSP